MKTLLPKSLRRLLIALPLTFLGAVSLSATDYPTAVSPDGRFLQTAEGEPFIWIGDTAWELFHKLDREEALTYLDKRAAQGFTVIQAVVLAEEDGLRKPNPYGHLPLIDEDPTRPNEAYFQHVDFIVNAAAERGLTIGMLPTWGDKVISDNPGAGPIVFTAENARSYANFLGKRYHNAPVVWILGGDRNVDYPEARAVWNSMGQALKASTDGQQLVSYHPRGNENSARFFHTEDWLDFNMYQTGHQDRAVPVYRFAEASAVFEPRKPFVEGEPAYEDIAVRFWEYMDFSKWNLERVPAGVLNPDGTIRDRGHFSAGFVTAKDVRRLAYWNLLSGAAGYTYGNNAVWQMFRRGEPIAIPPLTDWREALDRPGAQDMRHLHTLWKSRPFSQLKPHQSLIVGANPETPSHRRAAIADDGEYALVYLPFSWPVTVQVNKLTGSETVAWWFNPRDGSRKKIGTYQTNNDITFMPPSAEENADWLLVLDAASRDLPPLGQAYK